MDHFELVSKYKPTGDQPQAIEKLVNGLKSGLNEQVLLGVTGSGKTFTMANVIAGINKPTLILAHNKTLAGQLCSEMREFFPHNAVEYFVSYYDYYQPEAYIPSSDTYIEKDSSINEEIDKLRHSATFSLLERKDTIVVSSVSCIYGLGDPDEYKKRVLMVEQNTVLFYGTVLENITMEWNAAPDEIDEVVVACGLSEFVAEHGLAYAIPYGGENLSSGERQRIGIARLLLRKPDVIILDEPTSALDHDLKEAVSKGIVDFAKKHKMTLVIICHGEEFDPYSSQIIQL